MLSNHQNKFCWIEHLLCKLLSSFCFQLVANSCCLNRPHKLVRIWWWVLWAVVERYACDEKFKFMFRKLSKQSISKSIYTEASEYLSCLWMAVFSLKLCAYFYFFRLIKKLYNLQTIFRIFNSAQSISKRIFSFVMTMIEKNKNNQRWFSVSDYCRSCSICVAELYGSFCLREFRFQIVCKFLSSESIT